MIIKYIKYIETINSHIQKFFEQQKPYIHCKEGCSICCEKGHYPLTELEYEYVKIGFNNLSLEEKQSIKDKAIKIKMEIQNSQEEKPYYECPFLLNKRCSIYKHRGIICRTYGLLHFYETKDGTQKFNIPCCVSNGLNYSNVYDEEKQTISAEKYKLSNIKEEPLSYNLGLNYLLNNELTKDITFGETKALIDWLE